MARCYPEDPHFADDRTAERRLWEALRDQLPADAVLFHGVNVLDRQREQEIDVLVAWPGVGLAAIEVKGGHVTRDGQGWSQESGGTKRRIDSPVMQAQDGKKTLMRVLEQRASSRPGYRNAHLVALPFTRVPAGWSPVDTDRSCVLDQTDLTDVARRVREAVEQHGTGHRVMGAEDVELVVTTLSAELVGQTALLSAAEEHAVRIDQLTRDQSKLAGLLKHQQRALVIGGAGTGKTHVALEQARLRVQAGERVALVCYSRGLARYLERRTQAWPGAKRPAYVGLFHDLPVLWGAEPPTEDSDDFETRLPRELGELARAKAPGELFDTVIVDEGQDFGALWWPSLLSCLRDPATGGLFVFLDRAQRVFAREGEVPIDLPPLALEVNIRNTKRIAQLFSSMGGHGQARQMDGPKVRVVECATGAEVLERADAAVAALLEQGWDPGHIALLATQHRHGLQREVVETSGWAAYWDEFFAEQTVFYGHVLGFKGLERRAVVLAVNGFRDIERARELLYVGLSRATTMLVLVGQRDLVEQIGGAGVANRLKDAEVWTP